MYYVFNHIDIEVKYHDGRGEDWGGFRLMSVTVKPRRWFVLKHVTYVRLLSLSLPRDQRLWVIIIVGTVVKFNKQHAIKVPITFFFIFLICI